jgi:hypothetical protein
MENTTDTSISAAAASGFTTAQRGKEMDRAVEYVHILNK